MGLGRWSFVWQQHNRWWQRFANRKWFSKKLIIFNVNLMFQAERGWNWCQWRGNQITIWWKLGEFWNNNSLEINDPLREAEQIPNASSSTAQVQIASLCQSSGTATRVTSPWTLFTPAATSEVKMFMKLNCGNFREERKKFYRRQIFQEATKIFVSPKKILNLGWVEIKLLNEFSSSNMGGHKLP